MTLYDIEKIENTIMKLEKQIYEMQEMTYQLKETLAEIGYLDRGPISEIANKIKYSLANTEKSLYMSEALKDELKRIWYLEKDTLDGDTEIKWL